MVQGVSNSSIVHDAMIVDDLDYNAACGADGSDCQVCGEERERMILFRSEIAKT